MYLCAIFSLFPLIFVGFSKGAIYCLPIFSFFVAIIIYAKCHLNKSIEIFRHVLEGKLRVVTTNKYNQKKEIINIPRRNAYFLVTPMKEGEYSGKSRIHIWNDFYRGEELDLRNINLNNTPPKFYWSFKDISSYFRTYEVDKILQKLVGEDVTFRAKFFGKNHNALRLFENGKFLSYSFQNYVKWFIISISIAILIISHLIFTKLEKEYDNVAPIHAIFFNAVIIISIILLIFFHYNRRRMDIFVKDRNLFIGITSFTRGSYKKKYIFPLKDIDHWTFPKEKKTCLTIFLENKTSQKICSFSDDIEIIKSILDKLHYLLD